MPKSTSADVFAVMYNLVFAYIHTVHMNIHISGTPMLCDAGVGIHTVQHMTLYLQINTNNPCYKQII